MKVKIIEEDYEYLLENAINEWLRAKENSCLEIIDIKYSGRGYANPYGKSHVSAMIIYK